MHGESGVTRDSPEDPWFPAMVDRNPRNHNKQQQQQQQQNFHRERKRRKSELRANIRRRRKKKKWELEVRTLNTTRSCFHSWREASNLSHNNFLCILIFTRKYFSDFDFYLRLWKSERGKQWQASHKITTRGENVVDDSVDADLLALFVTKKKF